MKPLTIHVDDIKNAAQPWEVDLAREEIDEMLGGEVPSEYHAAGATKVHAKLTRMGRKVLVQSHFAVPLAGVCKRCLKDLTLDEAIELTLTYNPLPEGHGHDSGKKKPTVETLPEKGDKGAERARARRAHQDDGTDGSFEPQLADEEIYSGKTIDFWPAVREQILLAAPPSPVCREECKGLCPSCGQDLNERDCGHKQLAIDPRWEALRALQVQQDQPKQRKE